MKRVVSVLLLVCMLVSLMGMSVAAYAEENVGSAVNTEQVSNPPAADPTVTVPPEPTPEPTTEPTPEPTAPPEVTEQPQTTEKPADNEGFFAALSETEVTTLMADLAKLGYTVTDRAGLYALAVQHSLGDLNSFHTWLDDELYLYDNAVAEVNGKLYLTLDEALKTLDSARAVEIKLLKDTAVVGLEAPVEHELTLDLNNHMLTLAPNDDADRTPSYITVDEADKQSDDNPPAVTHVHGALIIKNGIVNASYENADAIVNKGALTLIKSRFTATCMSALTMALLHSALSRTAIFAAIWTQRKANTKPSPSPAANSSPMSPRISTAPCMSARRTRQRHFTPSRA